MSGLLVSFTSKLTCLRQLSTAKNTTAKVTFWSRSLALFQCNLLQQRRRVFSHERHALVRSISMTRFHGNCFRNLTTTKYLHDENCTFRDRCQRFILHVCVCAAAWFVLSIACKRNILCKDIQHDDAEYYDDPFEKSKDARLIKCKNAWIPKAIYDANNRLLSVKNFETRKDDIFVASFPKSGKTVL
jgi:hypothetical protein